MIIRVFFLPSLNLDVKKTQFTIITNIKQKRTQAESGWTGLHAYMYILVE